MQPNKIIQLVYSSIATSNLSSQDIRDILIRSRENNQRENITGILLYRQRSFIQVLEGPEPNVEMLFSRIEQDERHIDVLTLYQNEASERLFSNWAMAFNDDESEKIDGFSDFLHPYGSKDERKIPPSGIKKLLLRFKEVNKR